MTTIPEDRQFVPNKKTPVHVVSALNHMKTIWGWQDAEMKEGAINFLEKVLGNIRKNPDNAKMRDLNIRKIRLLTKKWKSIPMLILFNAGFQEDMLKGGRMTLDLSDMAQMNEIYDLFTNCKNFDPTKEPAKPVPIKKQTTEPAPMEVEKADAGEGEGEKGAPAETDSSKMEVDPPSDPTAGDAALAASLAAEEEPAEEWDDDMDDLLSRIKAEKAAKGLDTLNMSELQGLSKEEKIKLLEEKRAKFRRQKEKNAIKEKLEKERKQREAVKAQAEMQRKREEHQNKMIIAMKKKEKADNKRRKERAREKIRKQKEQRRKEKEAREAAKKKALES